MKTLQIILLITGILVAGIAFNTVAQSNEPAVASEQLAFKQEKQKNKNKDKIDKEKNKAQDKMEKEKNKDKNKNKEKNKNKDKNKDKQKADKQEA